MEMEDAHHHTDRTICLNNPKAKKVSQMCKNLKQPKFRLEHCSKRDPESPKTLWGNARGKVQE